MGDLFKALHAKTQFVESKVERTDVRHSIEELLLRITGELKKNYPYIKCAKIVPVGSSYEGTKVISPNEYDFIVVLGTIYDVDYLSFCKTCKRNGYDNVSLEKSNIDEKIYEILCGGFLDGNNRGLRKAFKIALDEICSSLSPKAIKKSSGTLVLDYHKTRTCTGPQFKLKLFWESQNHFWNTKISVDIVPAIEVVGTKKLAKNIPDKSVRRAFRKTNSIYLIQGTPGYNTCSVSCFRLSFAKTEFAAMQNLSKTHRTCYRILKFLVQSNFESVHLLTSYALKTAMLQHVRKCNCRWFPFNGMEDVIKILGKGIRNEHLGCIFNPNESAWKEKYTNEDEFEAAYSCCHKLKKFLK